MFLFWALPLFILIVVMVWIVFSATKREHMTSRHQGRAPGDE
jgi:cytochrome c-type biogenesis protein CcmH/NrfF